MVVEAVLPGVRILPIVGIVPVTRAHADLVCGANRRRYKLLSDDTLRFTAVRACHRGGSDAIASFILRSTFGRGHAAIRAGTTDH